MSKIVFRVIAPGSAEAGPRRCLATFTQYEGGEAGARGFVSLARESKPDQELEIEEIEVITTINILRTIPV